MRKPRSGHHTTFRGWSFLLRGEYRPRDTFWPQKSSIIPVVSTSSFPMHSLFGRVNRLGGHVDRIDIGGVGRASFGTCQLRIVRVTGRNHHGRSVGPLLAPRRIRAEAVTGTAY